MALPDAFILHLRAEGYHPRSNKHSNALALAVLDDLVRSCAEIRNEAAEGRLVYDLNMDLRFANANWNVDLVIGTPLVPVEVQHTAIEKQTPTTVRIALEIKGVMTEHRKAVKNRKRDFEAHHEHVHNYNRKTIAAGLLVVNASMSFKSPLRSAVTTHGDQDRMAAVVGHCLTEMRNVTMSSGNSAYGLDAKGLLVVNLDNVNLADAEFSTLPPAPRPGDPMHYDAFIQRLCDEYGDRFGRRR